MKRLEIPRENSLTTVYHPDHLRLEYPGGADKLIRVDHPAVNALTDGEPTLGWEGDPRLQMYVNPKDDVWVLMRFENDGQYRVVTVSPVGQTLNNEEVNKLILRLVAHDTRRGFDPKAATDAHNAQQDKSEVDQLSEYNAQKADKLAWAIRKDLGHLY